MDNSTRVRMVGTDSSGFRKALLALPTEPFATPEYLGAIGASLNSNPTVVEVAGDDWRGTVVLLLSSLPGGRLLARTPDFGGPQFQGAPHHAGTFRSALDDALRDRGVISEVTLFSPWCHPGDDVIAAWNARFEKLICVLPLAPADDLKSGMQRGRRYDLGIAEREFEVTTPPFTSELANEFALHYSEMMDSRNAESRWRLPPRYFDALSGHARSRLIAIKASNTKGGAIALFLVAESRAAYLHAVRWGESRGSSTLCASRGFELLREADVNEVNLGGGLTTDPVDTLLAFKQSFGGRTEPLLLSARAFDVAEHTRAVSSGLARPLPSGYQTP